MVCLTVALTSAQKAYLSLKSSILADFIGLQKQVID
jgi:hypothetical protein